jgi:hypothetical protein
MDTKAKNRKNSLRNYSTVEHAGRSTAVSLVPAEVSFGPLSVANCYPEHTTFGAEEGAGSTC